MKNRIQHLLSSMHLFRGCYWLEPRLYNNFSLRCRYVFWTNSTCLMINIEIKDKKYCIDSYFLRYITKLWCEHYMNHKYIILMGKTIHSSTTDFEIYSSTFNLMQQNLIDQDEFFYNFDFKLPIFYLVFFLTLKLRLPLCWIVIFQFYLTSWFHEFNPICWNYFN